MKKLLLCLFLFVICYADVVYYNGIFKLVNCKVISNEENEYVVETYTNNGISKMVLSKSLVDVIDYQPIDSTKITEIIGKTKQDEINITELNKIQRQKYQEEQEIIKKEQSDKKEIIKEIKIKENQPMTGDYYIKSNIPLLATGVALTTQGLVSLFSTGKINIRINEYESEGSLHESLIDELKDDLVKAYIYGAIFTIAGAIDIYYCFEKVKIELNSDGLNLSYNF